MHRVFFWLSSFSVTAAFKNKFLLPRQTDQSGTGDGRGRGGPTSARGSMAGGRAAGGPPLWDHVTWRKNPGPSPPCPRWASDGPLGSSVRSGRDRRVQAWWESTEKEEEKKKEKKKEKERRQGHKRLRLTAGCSQRGLNVWERLGSKSGLGGGERRRCERTVAFKQREGPQTLHVSKQDECLFTGHCWQPLVAKQIRNHRPTQTSTDDGKQNQWSSSSHWLGFRRFRLTVMTGCWKTVIIVMT